MFLTVHYWWDHMEPDSESFSAPRQLGKYRIKRGIYTEEQFQKNYERNTPSPRNRDFRIQGRVQCRFSWARFRKIILKMFPILNWLCAYRVREWFLSDIHAGLSVGMVQIPQGLSGVLLTRLPLPIVNGFYSAFCCSLTYVIFGTSHHISIGSFSILNAMVADVLKTLNFSSVLTTNGTFANFSDANYMKSYMEALTLTASTTFLTGIIQLLLGCFCLGFVTTYLPKTLIDAYLTAAALHVIVSQFSFIFGIVIKFHMGPLAIFYNLFHYCMALPKANATSILLFLVGLVMLRISNCIKITYKHSPVAFPMELLLIITFTIIANHVHLHAESSMLVAKMVPYRFLPPTLPDLSNLSSIVAHAFSLAIVSYFLLIFVGKRYSCIHNYSISSNQELMTVGLCNIFSSFFKSFAVSCAISGTVIQEKTGGKTQFAALIGASIMLVVVMKLGHFFQSLPNAVLAAIVMVNMFPFLEKFMDVPTLWRQDKYHFVIWIVTFAAVLCLGLDIGLIIAMGFTFFIITVRSHRMKIVMLGLIPNTDLYRSLSDYKAAAEIEGVKIFQCCSSISFANMRHFKGYLLQKMDVKAVPLDENEMRALISVSLSSTGLERKDLKCACVCDPPELLPRIPYTEKLVKRLHRDNESSSSSLNLIRWSKFERKRSSGTLTTGMLQTQHAQSTAIRLRAARPETGKKDEGKRIWNSSDVGVDTSTTLLCQEPVQLQSTEFSAYPVHTIILDFSMVQFVDLQASDLLRQMFHMFQNIGISVLIASCHLSVIAIFEKNDFFDDCVTKARFFLTLHDAVLAALEQNQRPETMALSTGQPDQELDEGLTEEQKERSLHSGNNKDTSSLKTTRSELLNEEPISDLFRTYSLQSETEMNVFQQYDAPPPEPGDRDEEWEQKWKYARDP
ncbi:testis anion transporter 1 isoform X1 [Gopherus flavomarginatus]|uniref:testis anion transporter 1 isoform X1 n=2 Tax=Gopherus flavomarginatus TaxID=286002 RepID=UPI0021CBBA31|nr:testis anion transporter 1 isoform X1 [Gopherus flavomarginatus]XP_050812554.1 testis anion transporter 1 isoform X1 [Gopherus flavomarginatus]